MCCIKGPKQKKCNKALYGESYICPASLSWVNTEFGERQPTPLLSLIPYVASALLEAGWKMRRRVPLPMHTCKAQKSSHIYCMNYPPTHRHTVTPTPPYHSWNRKRSLSIPSKLLSQASHLYQNHTVEPKAQACTAKNTAKIHCIGVRGKWILAGLHKHRGCELTVSLKGLCKEKKRQLRVKKKRRKRSKLMKMYYLKLFFTRHALHNWILFEIVIERLETSIILWKSLVSAGVAVGNTACEQKGIEVQQTCNT